MGQVKLEKLYLVQLSEFNSAVNNDLLFSLPQKYLLQGQYQKVKEIENQRGMLTKRVGQIEAQIAECKVVLMELGY